MATRARKKTLSAEELFAVPAAEPVQDTGPLYVHVETFNCWMTRDGKTFDSEEGAIEHLNMMVLDEWVAAYMQHIDENPAIYFTKRAKPGEPERLVEPKSMQIMKGRMRSIVEGAYAFMLNRQSEEGALV
jgi:hypothetical protein